MSPTAPTKRRYSTDLTDTQWQLIHPLVVRERRLGRPTEVDLREVVNALLYLTRLGGSRLNRRVSGVVAD